MLDGEAQPKQAGDSTGEASTEVESDINEDIDPLNEVQGIKILLIHIAICLSTFLVGLVRSKPKIPL